MLDPFEKETFPCFCIHRLIQKVSLQVTLSKSPLQRAGAKRNRPVLEGRVSMRRDGQSPLQRASRGKALARIRVDPHHKGSIRFLKGIRDSLGFSSYMYGTIGPDSG